ncbi:MAG TPA: glycosyltransferase family 4 protein [Mycobacterium sp.]|nr:glycosyltransferase family 4 protein [Mycobacterium sp.]HTX94126.1 glycosyltransferase family 4 protein [Mycobacterium sp.]
MDVVFIDATGSGYDPDTPFQRPLGGSQSAVCYLAPELAKLGHRVTLANDTAQAKLVRGVHCQPIRGIHDGILTNADCVVQVNGVVMLAELKAQCRPDARQILWTGHAHDQPAVAPLARPEIRAQLDGFALVSDWQAAWFCQAFDIDPARTAILRNAAGPAFADLFGGGPIMPAKEDPAMLCYTSTPFRGLDRLLAAFPRIRAAVPDARLEIYSSMAVYNSLPDPFQPLYDMARTSAGVAYHGSVAQPALAQALRRATMLAYPNTFPETSCIAVMEAMAAGCAVVTSELGALPETGAGFIDLTPPLADPQAHAEAFAERVIQVLAARQVDPAGTEAHLQAQVAYTVAENSWARRAEQWSTWLSMLA